MTTNAPYPRFYKFYAVTYSSYNKYDEYDYSTIFPQFPQLLEEFSVMDETTKTKSIRIASEELQKHLFSIERNHIDVSTQLLNFDKNQYAKLEYLTIPMSNVRNENSSFHKTKSRFKYLYLFESDKFKRNFNEDSFFLEIALFTSSDNITSVYDVYCNYKEVLDEIITHDIDDASIDIMKLSNNFYDFKNKHDLVEMIC